MISTPTGRRVLVTGAGSGIGKAIAERLARGGCSVIATVRDPERARNLTSDAQRAALALEYRALDLGSPDEIDALASGLEVGGGIDVLVNNAGYGVYGAVEDVEADQVARQFQVNLFGPLRLTRRLLPGLRRRRGRIVWIGSLAGRQSLAFQAAYAATKAATAAFSDALRMELKPLGVSVSCVEPGDVATGFTSARVIVANDASVYAERARRSLAAVEREEQSSPGPECVARAVEKLVLRRRSPPRVATGHMGRAIALFLRLVPHAVAQSVVARLYRF